jgi:hypothetical protein
VEVTIKARVEPSPDGGQWALWVLGLVTAGLSAYLTTGPERRRLRSLRAGLHADDDDEEDAGGMHVHDLGLAHAVALVVIGSTARPPSIRPVSLLLMFNSVQNACVRACACGVRVRARTCVTRSIA